MERRKIPVSGKREDNGKSYPEIKENTRRTDEEHSERGAERTKNKTTVHFSSKLLWENDLYERQDS